MPWRAKRDTGAVLSRQWPLPGDLPEPTAEPANGVSERLWGDALGTFLEQSPFPTSAGPELWRRIVGRLVGSGPPVTGSRRSVSPVAIITHPRESSWLVKKSPSRRSWPVAAQVVPPWQMPPSWIDRTAAFTTVDCIVAGLSAPVMLAL